MRAVGTRRGAALIACALMVAALLSLPLGAPGRAWAMGGHATAEMEDSAMASHGAMDMEEGAEDCCTVEEDPDAEQLGLMPHLFRLTGWTGEAEDGLPLEGVGAFFPSLLSCTTTPQAIQVGKECSMVDVCGFDPCTCGKPDAWGHCACGGFQEETPVVTISVDDPGIARVQEAFGATWLMPVSPGTTTVSIEASLTHYRTATYEFQVEVAPFGPVDVLFIVAGLVVAAALCAGVVLGVRALVRLGRRAMRNRKMWAARGRELKKEFPLTWNAKLNEERNRETTKRKRQRRRVASPFLHDLLFSFRQAAAVLVAGLVLFAVLVPVSTSVVSDVSVFNVNYTHEQLKYQFYAQDLAGFINMAAVVFGAVLAIALFRFVLQKRSTTAFFSVGLSRVKLFLSRAIVGIVCIAAAIGLPFAASLLLNGISLGLYDGCVAEWAFTTVGYMLVAACSFALASVACVCAGTLFESVIFATALLLGVTAVLWSVGEVARLLLVGNAQGAFLYGQAIEVAPSLLDGLSAVNPVLFFQDLGAEHQFFMALHPVYYPELGPWWLLGVWACVVLALGAGALVLFCRRPGEQAEMAGKSPVLSLFSVAMAGLALFGCAIALLGTVDPSVAVVVGFALFALVSLVLLFGPLRGRTPRPVTLGCVGGELVAMGCVVAVVSAGAFGYAGNIPATDEVEAVEFSYDGSPSYLVSGFSGISGGNAYYYTSNRVYTDASSVDTVRSIHEQLIGTARQARETDFIDFDQTVVPYDIVIRYRLKGGGEVVRYYDQASVGELAAMLSLDNDEQIHRLESAVITGSTEGLSDEALASLAASPSVPAYASGAIYAADGILNRIVPVATDDIGRAELLSAMASDLSRLPASERYFPTQPVRAAVMFTLSPELDVASFGYSFSNAVSYVTDEWTETVAWLEEAGVLDQLAESVDPRAIEKLTFQLDDPYASINKVTQPQSRFFMGYRSGEADQYWVTQDYGALKTYTDQASIEAVLPKLRLGYFMDGGYLVEAKLRGIDSYVYFYLPAADVPDDF